MTTQVWIASYRRTPFGRFLGGLGTLLAVELGAHALAAAIRDAGVNPDSIDYVVGGHVLQSGAGQNPARQAALKAGVPLDVPAVTVNSVCLSGMEAILQGRRLIQSGEAQVVACLGQESMSQAPHVMRVREGTKYGPITGIDTVAWDGLTNSLTGESMGLGTDRENDELGISRAQQDEWALLSHQRSEHSRAFLDGEIEPVVIPQRKGDDLVISADEGVREGLTLDQLGALRPAFSETGSITAGNASPISDGAAAVILVSDAVAKTLNTAPVVRVVGGSFVAGPTTALHSQPARAIAQAAAHEGVDPATLAAIEINEAFASVAIQSVSDLGVDPDVVNVHGGAIALGHPIGASGTRIVGTLARQLAARPEPALGAAGICGGGGQGTAVLLAT